MAVGGKKIFLILFFLIKSYVSGALNFLNLLHTTGFPKNSEKKTRSNKPPIQDQSAGVQYKSFFSTPEWDI